MMTVIAEANTIEIDVDGLVDESTGIRYIGKATKTFGDRWLCLAIIGGEVLCRVELTVRPAVHVDGDPGDEDDRGPRRKKLERDLGRSLP